MYLKEHGVIRTIYTKEGNEILMRCPQTKADALAEGVRYYRPSDYIGTCTRDRATCPHKTCYTTIYFTISDIPMCCARSNAADAYRAAVACGEPTDPAQAREQGKDYYWRSIHGKNCGHVGMTRMDGKCYICHTEKSNSPRQRALESGEAFYMPADTDPCKNGHVALRRVANGECSQCVVAVPRVVSPRQQAIDAGEAFYMPAVTDPCRNGHVALRRVANGECSECLRPKTVRDTPIYKLYPDMVISYEMAKETGFKTFRTGEPCRRGHRAWRWVSTRNCLECMGR